MNFSNPEIILIPATLMVFLTLIAWIRMFMTRIPAMEEAKIDIKVVRSQKMKELLPEKANIPSEHFTNLFEVPVLFYCLSAFLFITGTITAFFVYGCFIYVGLRYIHSFIHLGYNDVMHRFIVYLLSCMVLWVMWIYFAFLLIQKSV